MYGLFTQAQSTSLKKAKKNKIMIHSECKILLVHEFLTDSAIYELSRRFLALDLHQPQPIQLIIRIILFPRKHPLQKNFKNIFLSF